MRKSGILMHITSLPGPHGIGTMGKTAYAFVDWLKAAGQSYWQVLPLNPTGCGDSPYQSFSTFAGNHYLIDLDTLVEEGLLLREEIDGICWADSPERVDYGKLYEHRCRVLRLAWDRFEPGEAFNRFVDDNREWLADYGLFMALKGKFQGRCWQDWSISLMMRIPEVMETFRNDLESEISFQYFLQYQFFRQWTALRQYANQKGIMIIGDVPIYVPLDSADVWANPRLFQLDKSHKPRFVAGCPPDSFSAEGQLWGNPLYNWDKMKETGYGWWIRRLKAAANMYDAVRLDHFRGFESYWSVPAEAKTAAAGKWEEGPGMDFINAIREALPDLAFIAEDLGYVTPQVRKLQEDSGYPGMKVIQFAFDSRETGDYYPHGYPVNSVCYTGTHDNPTLKQWLEEAKLEDVDQAGAYLGLNREEGFVWGMIRGCMASVSKLCIVQMQDYLELGAQARMNCPGTLSVKNWTWRAAPDLFSEALRGKVLEVTRRYGRC